MASMGESVYLQWHRLNLRHHCYQTLSAAAQVAWPRAKWWHPDPEEQAQYPAVGCCLNATGSSRSIHVGKYAELVIGVVISNTVNGSAGVGAVDTRIVAAVGKGDDADMCGKRKI